MVDINKNNAGGSIWSRLLRFFAVTMNDINNWREEETLDLTSDLSSHESDKSADVETSITTVKPQDTSVNSSAVLEAKTPISNMSAGNISRPPRPQRVPLVKTQEDNEALRQQVVELNLQFQYYLLQNSRLDLINEREELAALRRQLKAEADQAEANAQMKLENLNAELQDCEREKKGLQQQNELQKERIAELECALAKMEEIPTSLDGLKGDDSDWTIRSECDIIASELRERLSAAEKENELLHRKIESLQKELDEKAVAANDIASQSKAYMSRYHKLEKKLQEGQVLVGSSSFNNKEEARERAVQIYDRLCNLALENRELRKECARLCKQNSILSANSTSHSIRHTESPSFIDAVADKSSLLTDEHLEEKQKELLRDLEAFIANAGEHDSLIDVMKDASIDFLHISDADFSSHSRGSADRSDMRDPPKDSIAPDNLSMVNASLVELMNLSLNTSKDIANFRERLGLFRGMMERIFETLRNSGLLLEEVLEQLGSESDEHKQLADKIRAMKFAWNTCLNETHNIMGVIDDLWRTYLFKAEGARDAARSTHETISKRISDFEAEIAQLSEERDKLIAAAKSYEAERKELRASLQEQKSAMEHLSADQSQIRQNAEALLKEVADKDATIIELEGKLMLSKKSCEKLKTAILEREDDVRKLQEALEQEHQRKVMENNTLKADLVAAQESSQSLRRDIEKICNEYNMKEATIRHLKEQLQTAAESVKSREAQTDMTRTALAQIELDSVSYSSELKELHTAYRELATAIGELVVKDVSNIPISGDIISIERSCKELSRLIRHEKRRRDQQAVEIAEVTNKVNDLHRKGALVEAGQNDIPGAVSSDTPNYTPPQQSRRLLPQPVYTDSAAEVVLTMVDFKKVIDQARILRNELNERFVIVRAEKENMHNYHLSDLINMVGLSKWLLKLFSSFDLCAQVELLSKDNRALHDSLNRCKAEYENLEKKNVNNPELAKKIAAQLRNIHAVMEWLLRKTNCRTCMAEECTARQSDLEATSSRGSTSVRIDRLFDSSDRTASISELEYDAVVQGNVARTTVSGLELLMLYLEAEIHRARAFIRDCGVRFRRFFKGSSIIDFSRIARLFINLADRRFAVDMSDLNQDAAMIFNVVPLRSRWKPPKYTFNDIELVLTTDEQVEDGVVHAYTVRSPAWSCLPPPLTSHHSETDLREFQFFNRPLKMSVTADEDEERMSLPSTMATDQELKSLEAQLALLSKQMQSLLTGKGGPIVAVPAGPFDCSPSASDDEGKGTSLCSPADTVKVIVPPEGQQISALPKVRPPNGPPPPPPPPPSSLSTSSISLSKNSPTPVKCPSNIRLVGFVRVMIPPT
ncbi:hypothetical protein ANCCEY_11835 [Ancylostoma ceylanicum]|uniref:Uncharacterized protein n=1 Tax=Ancylostoma ceylanicum TaxID=53326 RepID=A0A0D6LN60_9BILA|nr:hypothetical protein ANCCEY_11835 [Ancylostoma ceylanicum]